jgi:hypothetical protein
MSEESTRPLEGEAREVSLAEAIREASQQYEVYVRLVTVAQLAATTRDELRSYRRTWNHPLGLVMNAGVEPTSR